MATQSVRSNAVPAGGPTTQQPVAPMLAPEDVAALQDMLTPTVTKFRDQSVFQWVPLPQQSLSLGTQGTIQISNVGLGTLILSEHVVVINFSNSATAAGTVSVGATFPFNMLQDTTIQVNGGATTHTADGYADLLVALRNRRGALGNNRLDQLTPGLSPALVRMTFDASLTPTYLGRGDNTLSGIKSISVAAGTVSKPLTVTFYTIEKVAKDFDTLVGCLPLQNSSTYATLARTPVGTLIAGTAAANNAPFYNASAGTTTAALGSWTVNTQYCFASIPADPTLYADMIGNSYQIIEQRALSTAANGPQALQYNIPNNHYLTALHLITWDNNNTYFVPVIAFSNFKLQYNSGGVVPLQQKLGHQLAKAWMDYESHHGDLPGYLLWDGNATSDQITISDSMGWLNCYEVAEPQFIADISTAQTATPFITTATRESVVSGSVQVIGG